MDEAKRLNMLDGHFFWLWIDASKELDVFHTISNKIEYTDDLEDFDGFSDKDEALRQDLPERRKRDDADNNSVKDMMSLNTTRQAEIDSKDEIDKYVENNSSMKLGFRRNSRSRDKSEAHSVNNKLLNINFSQEFDSSRKISSENISNYDYVNNKGVETSKIGKNSIEKGKMSFLYRDSSRRTSYSKTKNESFNKYVNSINVDGMYAENSYLKQEVIDYSEESSNSKDSVFSSDISDFLMNPAVHMAKMHSVRDTIDKRKENNSSKEIDDDDDKNNMTVIINNLPVGLLALHPQPMRIGKFNTKDKNTVVILYFIYHPEVHAPPSTFSRKLA